MSNQIVAGVDISGAKDAPSDAWIVCGSITSMGLEITDVRKVGAHALARELDAIKPAACGIDVPFGLPQAFLEFFAEKKGHKPYQAWQDVVESLIFTDFVAFAKMVDQFKTEAKRVVDQKYTGVVPSPLHKGNPPMVDMTYHGMRVLASLDPKKYSVLPFHDLAADTCAVIEVFAPTVLTSLGLQSEGYSSSDSKDKEKMQAIRRGMLHDLLELRERNGYAFRRHPRITIEKKWHHQIVESDHAFDAVIACYATALWKLVPEFFADPYAEDDENVLLEGWIYVPAKAE